MSEPIDRKRVRELFIQAEPPCVSVCLPVSRGAPESDKNRILFKNLVDQAEENLVAGGMRGSKAVELLEPVKRLLEDDRIRRPQGDGLAVYRSPTLFECIELPEPCEAVAVAGMHLHVKPLIHLVTDGGGRFFLLALAMHQAKLFEGSAASLRERSSATMPVGLTQPTPEAESGRPLQFRTQAARQSSDRPAIYHGQDSEAATGDERLMRYLRQVDAAVCTNLASESAPLIVAAVNDLASKYAQVNSYANLVADPISGNPEHANPDELQRQALNRLQPIRAAERSKAIERYRAALPRQMASDSVVKIVAAGFAGKVDTLLVAMDQQHWGRFDSDTQRATSDPTRTPTSEDLLNLAAAFALQHGATVYGLSSDEMPDGPAAAAIFRR